MWRHLGSHVAGGHHAPQRQGADELLRMRNTGTTAPKMLSKRRPGSAGSGSRACAPLQADPGRMEHGVALVATELTVLDEPPEIIESSL